MSVKWKFTARALACAGAAAVIGMAPMGAKAQAPAPPAGAQPPAAGGGRGAAGGVGPQLFTIFDADKDGSVTAAEIKTAFDAWYDAADTQKSGIGQQDQALDRAQRGARSPAGTGRRSWPPARGGAGRGPTEFVAGVDNAGSQRAVRRTQPAADSRPARATSSR